MIALLPHLLLALAGAFLLLVLLDRLIRDPRAGAVLLLGTGVLGTVLGELPGLVVGSFLVTVGDVMTALLVGAVAGRLLRGARLSGPAAALAGLAVLVAFSIARGAGEFGLATAVNEARSILAFLASALYFSTVEPTADRREAVAGVWFLATALLILLALWRWIVVLGGLPFTGEWYLPSYWGLRVLWSDETLLLAQTFFILLPGLLRGSLSRQLRWLAAAALGSVLILQHRSVWAVALVGVALVLVQEGAVGRRWALRLLAGAGVAAVLLLTVFSGPVQERVLASSDAVDVGTFEWRLEGWSALVRHAGPQSLGEAVAGRPFGSGWARRLPQLGYTTDVAPHNYYLEVALRVGVLGLVLLLLAYALPLQRLLKRRLPRRDLFDDRTLAILLVTQLVYYIPYAPAPEQALVLGLAIGASRQLSNRAAERAWPPAAGTGGRGPRGCVVG